MKKVVDSIVFIIASVLMFPVIVFGWLCGGLMDVVDERDPFSEGSCLDGFMNGLIRELWFK